MLLLCRRPSSKWLTRSFTVPRRPYSTPKKQTGAKTELKITEESDFAFRKTQISELGFAEQDRLYYPTLGECLCELTNGVDSFTKMRVPEFRSKYSQVVTPENIAEFADGPLYVLAGKVKSIRRAGKGSIFVDVVQDYTKVQFIVHHKVMGLEKDEFLRLHGGFRPGDQVLGIGRVGVTKVGELSLKLTKPLKLASPALHPLPPKLNDTGKINHNRVVDYLVNQESKDVILLRCRVIQLVRNFLEERGFLSMETPILCSGNSGANARPFETSSQHLDVGEAGNSTLNLRVAPELWLKKLVIAGFDKIYEIGKSFRNEGLDSTHNPEFTTCEFYQTFIGLEELMQLSEDMVHAILRSVLADSRFAGFHTNCQELTDRLEANGGRFRRIEFLGELERQTGVKLNPDSLHRDGLEEYFREVCRRTDAAVPGDLPNCSAAELVNRLSETYVEPVCASGDAAGTPTFIYNIPEVVSPLSKADSRGVSRRFEMYIDGREYMNAYEEENNPFKQRHKFEQQTQNRELHGDGESLVPDHRFVEAMEWAMPPTGGWGLGIDRLVMKLSSSGRIENVLPFGKLNDVVKQ